MSKEIDDAVNQIIAQGIATHEQLYTQSKRKDLVAKRWKVWRMLNNKGFRQNKIASYFHVSTAAVCRSLKKQSQQIELDRIKSKIIKF